MMIRPLLVLLVLVLALVAPPGCEGNHAVTSPVVRVDLRHKLPPAAQRRIVAVDTSHECRHPFTLAAEGASQHFVATFRVYDDGAAQHVTAVQIEPEGPTSGGTDPTASALVDEIVFRQRDKVALATVPVRVTWSATKGCSGKLSASTRLELAADTTGCKPPAPAGKLLVPVK